MTQQLLNTEERLLNVISSVIVGIQASGNTLNLSLILRFITRITIKVFTLNFINAYYTHIKMQWRMKNKNTQII